MLQLCDQVATYLKTAPLNYSVAYRQVSLNLLDGSLAAGKLHHKLSLLVKLFLILAIMVCRTVVGLAMVCLALAVLVAGKSTCLQCAFAPQRGLAHGI